MTLCAGRDDDRIDAAVEELFRTLCRARPERPGHLGGTHGVGVGQEERDALEPAERLGVESADPPDTDDPDTEWCRHRHGTPTVSTRGCQRHAGSTRRMELAGLEPATSWVR